MSEIEDFLSDICNYAQGRIDKDPVLGINMTTRTSEGEKPTVVRQMTGVDKLLMIVTFMETYEDANSQ
jgi:hypothetical protein